MGVVGLTNFAVLLAPMMVSFNTAFCLVSFVIMRLPRPTRGIEGPPRFVVPRGAAHWAAKRIWYTVRLDDMLLALLPGLLAAMRSDAEAAARTGVVGWGALLVILWLPPGAVLFWLPCFFAYSWAFKEQLRAARRADEDERAIRCIRQMDAAMMRAECDLPSCPRCRLADRDSTGWCASCRAMLSTGAIGVDDWRARVGDRSALEDDGSLFARCAARMTRSYFGAGGESYSIRKAARDSGVPLPLDPAAAEGHVYQHAVEQAYADPKRSDLVWVRLRTAVSCDTGDAYGNVRVEAWGFVDGLFAQAWVFAPLSAGVPVPTSHAEHGEPDAPGPPGAPAVGFPMA